MEWFRSGMWRTGDMADQFLQKMVVQPIVEREVNVLKPHTLGLRGTISKKASVISKKSAYWITLGWYAIMYGPVR
jgi:hypothetical protein